MNVSSKLEKTLRKNKRNKNLPEFLHYLSGALDTSSEEIIVVSLEENDEVLQKCGDKSFDEKRFVYTTSQDLKDLFERLKGQMPDEDVFLYSMPLSLSCGAVKISLHRFFDRALNLVSLNGNSVSVVSLIDCNRFSLSYDTDYCSDFGGAGFDLDVRGGRFLERCD